MTLEDVAQTWAQMDNGQGYLRARSVGSKTVMAVAKVYISTNSWTCLISGVSGCDVLVDAETVLRHGKAVEKEIAMALFPMLPDMLQYNSNQLDTNDSI